MPDNVVYDAVIVQSDIQTYLACILMKTWSENVSQILDIYIGRLFNVRYPPHTQVLMSD